MKPRLNPLYKRLLMLSIVIGPIVWLMFTDDGRRRTDLVVLYLFGKGELNLAIEELHSSMTEAQFRELFPDLDLTCDEGTNPFGNRLCTGELGAFNAIPSRAFSLFLDGDRLQAAKLNYRRAYHETLKQQLSNRVGTPVPRSPHGPVSIRAPLSWVISDGLLLLPAQVPESDQDAALMWLSEAALQQRIQANGGRP